MRLHELLFEEVHWIRDPERKAFFYAEVRGRRVELRLNNFPDKVLCTLFLGTEILDLDDWGKNWYLPN